MIIGHEKLRKFHLYGKFRGDRVFRPLYLTGIGPVRVGRLADADRIRVVPGAEQELYEFVNRLENKYEGWEIEAREVNHERR